MRCGEALWAVGVPVQALRYSERRGLLAQLPRPGSGYREYPDEALTRLRPITHTQISGLSLDETAAPRSPGWSPSANPHHANSP